MDEWNDSYRKNLVLESVIMPEEEKSKEETIREEFPWLFYTARELLDQADIVSSTGKAGGKLRYSPIVQPVVFWSTKKNRIEGNRVDDGIEIFTQKQTSASTSPQTFTVPAADEGGWELLAVAALLDADGNAANRSLTVEIDLGTIVALSDKITGTGAVVVSANQTGSIYMNAGGSPKTFLNDNGTITTEDTNALPQRLNVAGTIQAIYTNDQATDVMDSQIWYTKPSNITDES